MRLDREEYKYIERVLHRYNYNKKKTQFIKDDLMSLSAINIDGLPKGKNNVSDVVGTTVIKVSENSELKKAIIEYKAVDLAKELLDEDSIFILEHLYIKQDMYKWDIINAKALSISTFKRKKQKIIYEVSEQIKVMKKILSQN